MHASPPAPVHPHLEPASVVQMTSLQASGGLAEWLAQMSDAVATRDSSAASAYANVNLGHDERQELREQLLAKLDSYLPDDRGSDGESDLGDFDDD